MRFRTLHTGGQVLGRGADNLSCGRGCRRGGAGAAAAAECIPAHHVVVFVACLPVVPRFDARVGPLLSSPRGRRVVVSTGAPTVLDADALARLRELDPSGKSRLVERVLRAFETSSARLAVQFREARERDDLQGIRHVVHTLKSSSASIGALALARICAEIETSIRDQAPGDLTPRLDAMDRELVAVLQAVTPMLTPGTPT